MSMNGFKLILYVFVCSNAVFNCCMLSQFMWIVPWSNLSADKGWFLNDLNLGKFFKAMFNLVAAPLYSTFFSLL